MIYILCAISVWKLPSTFLYKVCDCGGLHYTYVANVWVVFTTHLIEMCEYCSEHDACVTNVCMLASTNLKNTCDCCGVYRECAMSVWVLPPTHLKELCDCGGMYFALVTRIWAFIFTTTLSKECVWLLWCEFWRRNECSSAAVPSPQRSVLLWWCASSMCK